ncbi:MAG: error-prone DNA polymerase [Gammaproteobacteria bacterium]|nr:error-prone DNA polymerase [Gammaproteobacteria bacterium]
MHYSELYCLSNFSFLRAASHPQELVRQAAQLGYQALAITDECSVAGIVRAYQAIRQEQLSIQLIIGCELRLQQQELVVIAPTRQAYAQLCQLITQARSRAPKGQYQVQPEDFNQLDQCLLIWLPNPEHPSALLTASLLQHHGRLWLGCHRRLDHQDLQRQNHCQQLAHQYDLPVCAVGQVYMHHPNRQMLHDTLTAIRKGVPIQDCGYALLGNREHSLRPVHKLVRLYPASWLQATQDISQQCQFCLSELSYQHPAELVPQGFTPDSYLHYLVDQGKRIRFPDGVPAAINDTIEKELQLIVEQGYAHFFLTTYDLVQFAKQQQILYQGRGSAANSIVCYCLEITAVDPRQINVLFERFISKQRAQPPDIDVDFEHQRREEVIQYIYQKYGRQRAALAATVITYRFNSAVRDVGKALGLSLPRLELFIKHIDHRDQQQNWATALPQLGLGPNSYLGQRLVQLVKAIIGFPRHLSQHVGGFIISAGPLTELVPIENAAMAQRTVIQWDKDDLQSLALLKVDVLALGILSAIRQTLQLIKQHHHRDLQLVDITRMEDDNQVYSMLQQGDSMGVFQVESRAQMSMLPRLRPACFYDLVVQVAIVRPGPIQGDMVHPYLQRRAGKAAVDYPSDEVREVLQRTLGVPIFQEQVIKLAMVAAGFSGGEADQLRRAMANWQRHGQVDKFHRKLVAGMVARGYEADFAERLYQQILGFGEYGFPESHAASFAVLVYVSAWLKYYYPSAFYCALLNSQPMGFYSPSQLLQDARRRGLSILPVCVNASSWEHIIEAQADNTGPALRLGLRQINGLRHQAIAQLLAARPPQGFQHSQQLQALQLPNHQLQALASANALQAISGHRYQARWQLLDQHQAMPLFTQQHDQDDIQLPVPDALAELTEDYKSMHLSLTQHPITLLRKAGLLHGTHTATELQTLPHRRPVTIAGLVTGRQRPGSAAGVTFITLEDETGNTNLVVWQGTAKAQRQAYLQARILKVKGILERDPDSKVVHVIAGRLTDCSHLLDQLNIISRDFH